MARRKATAEECERIVELENAAQIAKGDAEQAYRRLRAECGQPVGYLLDPLSGDWLEPPEVRAARKAAQTGPNGAEVKG